MKPAIQEAAPQLLEECQSRDKTSLLLYLIDVDKVVNDRVDQAIIRSQQMKFPP